MHSGVRCQLLLFLSSDEQDWWQRSNENQLPNAREAKSEHPRLDRIVLENNQ
jgi:hypothetical protein